MKQTPDEPMTTEEIVDALQAEYEAAESYRDSELVDDQAAALDYYDGQPLGNEIEGRSQIIMNVVQETVDYMTISVLRLFVSGDRVVEFEATKQEFEEGADDATEAISYNFMRKQDGYKIMHSMLQSGLLERYGVVKTACQTVERVRRETLVVGDMELAALESGELDQYIDAEFENATENEDGTFNAVVKYETTEKQYIDIPVPSEEYRFSNRATHEDDLDYQAHVCPKTRSELVEMGFDRDQVYELPAYDDIIDSRLNSRDRDEYWRREESTKALEQVLLCEEYARMDVDGDGIAERVKVFRVEKQILIEAETGKPSIETVDEQPFVVFTPFPRAHRMIGNSLADKTMDVHAIKTVTARQLMDGMYSSNMPRPLVDMNNLHESTIADLLTPVPGAPIRYNGQAPQPYQTNFDVSKSLTVLEYWNSEQESASGVTRLNRGLNADSLNGDTATEFAGLKEGAEQYEEFIARNFAEALSRLFGKKLRLMKREAEKMDIKVGGEYKTIDPSTWPEDFNVNIKVGLGTGNKDKRIQHRTMILELQREALEIGLTDKERLYNSAADLVRDLGLGQPDRYFADPVVEAEKKQQQADEMAARGEEPQPEPPSPEEQQMQAEMQMQQAKLQGEQQMAQAKMQGEQELASIRLQIQQAEGESKAALQREQAALTLQLAQEKAAAEAQLARDKAMFEQEMAIQRTTFEQSMAVQQHDDAQLSKLREGGQLDK